MTLRMFLNEWREWLTVATMLKLRVIMASPLDAPMSAYVDVAKARAVWFALVFAAFWIVAVTYTQIDNEIARRRDRR